MTPETQILPPDHLPTPTPAPQTDAQASTSNAEFPPHRHTGKIARLPKATRDKINSWLQDGLPYLQIIQRLGDEATGITDGNLSEWKKRGHQDWLVEQSFLERTRLRQESASSLAQNFDATEVSHAALQLGALHLFEALRDLGPGTLDQKLGGDSVAFTRLIHALARVSRETVQLQRYRELCAQARAALLPLKDPHRKLTDAENLAIVRKVDEILGLASIDEPAPPMPYVPNTLIEGRPVHPPQEPPSSAVPNPTPPPEQMAAA